MVIRQKTIAASLLCLSAVLCAPRILRAQAPQLVRVKQFSTLSGTIDFLPGAWVRVRQDNKRSKYYRFRGSRFVQASKLPHLIRQWESFNWRSVDVLNQVAIHNYNPDLDHFLPKHKRVKNVIELPLRVEGKELVLVCFTEQTTEKFSEPGATDIYLAGILGQGTGSRAVYKQLWTRKVEADASYGNLSVQNIPHIGRFVLLYWVSVGGSGGENSLDIYRVK